MAERKIYQNHFRADGIDGFHVLLVAPTPSGEMLFDVPFSRRTAAVFRTDLWRFAAHTDITPDTLLTSEIWYPCGSGPAERLPAIGAGVRPGDAADPGKIEGERAATADRGPAGILAGGAGGGEPGGGGTIAEAVERDVGMPE